MSRTALVTGAAGFIGSHLCRRLAAEGWRTRALDVDAPGLELHLGGLTGIEPLAHDLEDLGHGAVAGVDTVFHLAAAHLGAGVPEAEFERINVRATAALARAARRAEVRRFVHLSSVGVYGPLATVPADEDSPCRPGLAYERTKLAGEAKVREELERGLPGVILRPAWVYGPGCPRTEKLFRAISRGRFLLTGPRQTRRHCLYIDDMIAAALRAAEAEEALGGLFIVGDLEPTTVEALVREIARLTGGPVPRRVPLPLFLAAATCAELFFRVLRREPPVSRRTARFFTGNTAFRVERMRRVLGFEPRYTVPVGLAETWRRLGGA